MGLHGMAKGSSRGQTGYIVLTLGGCASGRWFLAISRFSVPSHRFHSSHARTYRFLSVASRDHYRVWLAGGSSWPGTGWRHCVLVLQADRQHRLDIISDFCASFLYSFSLFFFSSFIVRSSVDVMVALG
ncbi:uncharacterized protein B0H64DRAFT_226870 [Chaetomium fimeti]|uniref:Uncharacterized protein n=1 Tax=Chaetomium fimeti TaxID=1854472 RepID=A0AAE0LPM9_9PEZI|nr:hypothetical protein B0H64DRAFT_226870 [Chaetomium fimeti]